MAPAEKKNHYPEIASSAAAREYTHEGIGILGEGQLARLEKGNSIRRAQTRFGQNMLQYKIQEVLRQNSNVEIILLAPPTDFMKALYNDPSGGLHVKKIHLMGGWVVQEGSAYSTYNWNMDPVASAELLASATHGAAETILYSSHVIKTTFNGGSVSPATPQGAALISLMQERSKTVPGLADFFRAASSWNSHLIEKIPVLKNVIGPYVDAQFTPADPLLIAGIVNEKVISSKVRMDVSMSTERPDPKRGFDITATPSGEKSRSNLFLVEAVNTEAFYDVAMSSIRQLPESKDDGTNYVNCDRVLGDIGQANQ